MLSEQLSQSLIAYTIEFDNEFEHHLPHRTRAMLADPVKALSRHHLRQLLTYQPADRFWTFQWYETGIFVVLALALAWFCAWRIGRRRLA